MVMEIPLSRYDAPILDDLPILSSGGKFQLEVARFLLQSAARDFGLLSRANPQLKPVHYPFQ